MNVRCLKRLVEDGQHVKRELGANKGKSKRETK